MKGFKDLSRTHQNIVVGQVVDLLHIGLTKEQITRVLNRPEEFINEVLDIIKTANENREKQSNNGEKVEEA